MSPWLDSRIPNSRVPRTEHSPRKIKADWLTGGKSRNRRGHVGGIPFANARQGRVRQRTVQIGPDPGLVVQILRLSVAPVEPGKGAEQARVSLRRHDGV